MSSAPSPRKANGALLRLHPRGPPPFHMNHAPPPPAASAGYPTVSLRHRSRMSPRQVKLQRMEPSPPYTIATPLREQVSTSFRHELFQFHQLLRDAIDASHQDHNMVNIIDTQRPKLLSRDRRLLELLTSDRGDAVLKEFFVQWQQFLRRKHVHQPSKDDDDGSVLWDVLETFFANLPFVVSEADAGGTTSPKALLRYVDSLNSLRDLLLALLFKPRSAEDTSDLSQDESDEEEALDLQSTIGLGFGLNFNAGRGGGHASPRSIRQPPVMDRSRGRTPYYLYCQKLENELEALRRRVPHRRPRSPGVVAGILGDGGFMQDNTVMLLLDFWGLPHEERLAFFCQIASQASEQDASAILHVFLDNCTAERFLQVWEALQQSPQFQKMLRETKLQLEPARADVKVTPSNETTENEKEKAEVDMEKNDIEKPLVLRGSQRNLKKRGRRSTRFVDLKGITEAYDDLEDDEGGDSSDDKGEEEIKFGRGDTHRDSPRFQKIKIRERGRLSLSGPSDQAQEENKGSRRRSFRRNDHSRRQLKLSQTSEALPLLDRLHENLTEIIKMENGPDVDVMDAVWQLLEALDGHRMHDSRSGYHRRHMPLPAPIPVVPVQLQQLPQQITVQHPRASLQTPLSPEQQFLMKLDQLQSMLAALGEVRVHTMSTETITGAYRRIPLLAKLFAAVTDTSLGAAGVDTAGGGMSKVVHTYSKEQHLASTWQNDLSKDKIIDPRPAAPGITPTTTAGDNVREDVEAMAVLLVKLSKFVRNLAPLVDNEVLVPSNMSASDDVLAILDLADKLEKAGGLVESPAVLKDSAEGKRRLSLAADREKPILLAVQSLARSNNFDTVSQLITTSVEAKMTRVRIAATEAATIDEEDDDDEDEDDADEVTMEGDEEVIRIVKNLRRTSAKATQAQTSAVFVQPRQAKDQLPLQIQGGQAGAGVNEDESTSTALRLPKNDIPASIKGAAALRGAKLFSVDILLRTINQLYRDNYEGMVSTLQYGNRRMEFSEFIYDWHIRKYGLKTLAQRHLLKLIQSLRKHGKKVYQCQLCLRFMGVQFYCWCQYFLHNPLGYHEHKFVLGLLSRWSLGTFLGGSKHRIELPNRQFKVRIVFATTTVQEALRERFGVYTRGMDALTERIRAKAHPRDEDFVRENDLLPLCVEEFGSQRALLEKVLGAVYQAGDINGDGSLEFDEFASVVMHLSPTVDDRFLQKIFDSAHDFTKPRRISFARFLDVILLERILSPALPSPATSGIARAKNAAAAAASSSTSGGGTSPATTASSSQPSNTSLKVQDEQEESYQFELLRETWTHDREAVAQVLQTSITHAPTAKSLTFRVAFLDQLLERRVDAKTAWLCHRQIMREIARFQHLDADQIAGLRRKEQQFKKAVSAIRNAQRLSTLFAIAPGAQDTADGEASPDTPSPSYTAAVHLSLDGQTTGTSNAADVMALENELRETFLERADEGAIDDYMAAMQHLRRMTVNRESLQLLFETREEQNQLRPEEAVSERSEESDSDDSDDDDEENEAKENEAEQ